MSGLFKTKEEKIEDKIQLWEELAREIMKVSDIADLPPETQELFLESYKKHLIEIKDLEFFPTKKKEFECHLVAYIHAFLCAYQNGGQNTKLRKA